MKSTRMKVSDLSSRDLASIRSGRSRSLLKGHKAASATTSKHRNVKTDVDGITFDSKLEAKRYSVLKIFEKSGAIRDLQLQVPFALEVNGLKICDYYADFVYFNDENGMVVEDAKGRRTDVYKLKKKLMKAVHNIDIKEVTKDNVGSP